MYIVDGFTFESEELAAAARKEEEGVRYIKEKTPLDNPNVVLNLYNKLLEQNLLTTPVGIRFLIELQNMLYASDTIPKESIQQIPTAGFVRENTIVKETVTNVPEKKKAKPDSYYKTGFQITLFLASVFAVCIIGMFTIIKMSDNNVNILNYREEIINEYTQWQAELEEKEAYLKDFEELLEKREEALK